MFIALDASGERISIESATKDNKYFCPICGEPLIIRAIDSLAVRTHFAHKRGTICYDDWSHDMSEWHFSWQQCFPEQCREVVIEKNGIKHRADICINNTVIEFQHSPITGEEIAKRNAFYLSCGYQVVWVFDATDKIKNRIEDFIDPMKCRDDDLCWKRAKQQFSIKIPPQVTVYLQYKTCVSNNHYPNQEFDIMLLLTKISPKYFTFYKTMPYYILPSNFLKQYGISLNDDVLSVTDIINQTKSFIQQEQARQYKANKQQIMNRMLIRNHPRRRWHL